MRPGQVVERLHNLAALHAGVARAGGHEPVDEHLRRLGPAQVRLRDAEPGLRQQRGGRVTLSLRGVLRVVAAAEFVQQVGREDIVVGKGQALVDLRRVVAALQRTAGLGAIGVSASRRRRGDNLAVFIGEAREDVLLVADAPVQPHIALVGGDRRRKVGLIVVGVGAGIAVVGLGHQLLKQVGRDGAHRYIGRIDGRNSVRLIDALNSLPSQIVCEVAAAHIRRRHAEHHGRLARQAQPLEAHKKEVPVRAFQQAWNFQRAAQRSAKVVHDDLRLGEREGIVRVQNGVLMVLEDPAVKVVGSSLGDGGDVGHAAKLGVVIGLADANLLDRVEGGKHLVHRAGVLHAHAGNAVDGHTEQRRGGAHHVQVAAIVGLHAGLGGERGDGAGGTCGAGVDGHG